MARKILVVEDDTFLCRLLELTLKRAGYEPIVVNNGMAGMKHVRAAPPPDLVLLDLMLPVMDGFEVLNQIRSDPATVDLPVIVVTGKTQETDRQLALQLGANDYITKPYRPQNILTRIEDQFTQRTVSAASIAPARIVLVVSPQRTDVCTLITSLGAALAHSGHDTALFNPDPYSVDHLLALDLEPPVSPSRLPEDGERAELLTLARRHSSGLCVLSNLEGSGDLGQLTAEDLQRCVDALSADGRTTLVTVPLSPPGELRQLAKQSKRILIVIRDQPTALAATRATLGLLTRLQIPESSIAFVLIGVAKDAGLTEIAPAVVGWLPDVYSAASSQVQELAATLLQELSTPTT